MSTVSGDTGILRFALGSRRLPSVTETLALGELARANALRRADAHGPRVVARLRGGASGRRLDGHRHCHFLSTDEDGDGRLDHLTIWCPDGLDAAAREVLAMPVLRSWWLGDHPIELVRVPLERAAGETRCGPVARSRRWRSHTPFLPVRHPKRGSSGVRDDYPDQVRLELRRRGLPEPLQVTATEDERADYWRGFRRERRHGDPADARAFGYQLIFREPVDGPIALGRHSHFGMGLFLPKS